MTTKPDLQTESGQLRRRNRELSILKSIAEALNHEVDLTQTVQTALEQVVELLDLNTGWVWLMHDETDESYVAAAQNLPPALSEGSRLMKGSCYCLRTFREGDLEGAANVNVVTCSRLSDRIDGTDGLRYHASIPLYAPSDKPLGVLNVASVGWRELTDDDLRLLYTVGDMISIAVERAKLFQRSAEAGAIEERNRLAREIHDTIAQGLTAISLQLESADALLEADSNRDKIRSTITHALELTRLNMEEARRSVVDLRAALLEGRSLAEALSILAEERSNDSGFRVEFEAVGAGHPLSGRIESGLYRIAQEALNNVASHANARRVDIRLTTTPQEVQLIIEDDGRGFSTDEEHEGFGLVGLNERARLLGGKLKLESSPGMGTRIEVRVPQPSGEQMLEEGAT